MSIKITAFLILSFFLSISSTVGAATITLTDIPDNKVFQRDYISHNYAVAVVGTYTDTVTSVEARVILVSDSSVIVNWTDINATINAGAFSGTLTVPQGGWYRIQVRVGNEPGTVSNGSNDWGVGLVVGIIGQSNGEIWTRNSYGISAGQCDCHTVTPNSRLSYYWGDLGGWYLPSAYSNENSGGVQFGNTLIASLDIPVAIVNYSVGAMPLLLEGATMGHGFGYFLGNGPSYTKNSPYTDFITALNAMGGAEFVLWIGSESDWEDNTSSGNYEGGLAALFDYLKDDIDANVTLIIDAMGAYTESGLTYANMSGWPIIRNKTITFANATEGVLISQIYDTGIGTACIHRDNAALVTDGTRMAQAILFSLGEQTYYRSPRITGTAVVDSTHIDVTIKHYGGTDFTPTSGITGFQVFNGASEVTVSGAARQDATTIRLTTSGDVGATPEVRYMFINNPALVGGVTNGVKDNSTLTLPLEPYNSALSTGTPWDNSQSPTPPVTLGPGYSGTASWH